MEYEEPKDGLDELIDGSDDEEDVPREKTQLLHLDGTTLWCPAAAVPTTNLLHYLELMDSDDSEVDDDHEKVEENKQAKDAELAEKREREMEIEDYRNGVKASTGTGLVPEKPTARKC